MSAPAPPRLHALDGLRAAMMLLGLVLHSAASYITVPLGAAWPFQDRARSAACDLLVFTIHLFRMPTFFVMAGFFAALLYQREGPRGYLSHRVRRILLPLAPAWALLGPLVLLGFAYANRRAGVGEGGASRGPLEGMRVAGLIHLWFLYDLLIFSVLAVPVVALVRRWRDPAAWFEAVVRGPAGLLVLAALTTLTLLPMEHPGLDTSTAFLPPPRVLLAYGVFFAFGWLLFGHRALLPVFAARTWPCLAGAVASAFAYLVTLTHHHDPPFPFRLVALASASAATWLFVFGLVGLFVRYFERPRPLQRWLADGAYWIYLVHLPFTIWVPGLLAPLGWPAGAKFAATLAVTVLATAGSYFLFVRSTWIGRVLNGRRSPRGLPPAGF